MKAFLSHTGADKDLVSIVQKKLTQNNAWYDAVDIENGESIPEKINEGLRIAAYTGSNLPAARRISARWPEKTCHPAGRVRQ